MIGPLLGSIFYGFVGYAYTFYIFSGFIMLILLLIITAVSAKINHEPKKNADRVNLLIKHVSSVS